MRHDGCPDGCREKRSQGLEERVARFRETLHEWAVERDLHVGGEHAGEDAGVIDHGDLWPLALDLAMNA